MRRLKRREGVRCKPQMEAYILCGLGIRTREQPTSAHYEQMDASDQLIIRGNAAKYPHAYKPSEATGKYLENALGLKRQG